MTADPGPVPQCAYCGGETDGSGCDKVGCQMFEDDLNRAIAPAGSPMEKQELLEDERIDRSATS
jgi:hypothetical protein